MERSESITKLTAALVKFSGKMTKVKKDSINPHFKNKYASLSTIIEGTQGELAECGLAVIQMPAGQNGLCTMLIHESGEYIAETYVMTPSKNDPQGLGSAITYQRRYALGAVLNLNIDEDDDGNQASTPKPPADDDKPWLNLMTKDGLPTSTYNEIQAALTEGKKFTLFDIKGKYKVSNEARQILKDEFNIS
jgi:hypothetical protein